MVRPATAAVALGVDMETREQAWANAGSRRRRRAGRGSMVVVFVGVRGVERGRWERWGGGKVGFVCVIEKSCDRAKKEDAGEEASSGSCQGKALAKMRLALSSHLLSCFPPRMRPQKTVFSCRILTS
jgi:hypothetical protein